MPNFSKKSRARLLTCDNRLQAICNTAILSFDFSVIWGHRGKETQNRMFKDKRSQVQFPNSRHNFMPSMAVDVAPYPIDFEDRERFTYLAGLLIGVGAMMGIPLRWGGDWDRDTQVNDNDFDDLGHFELLQRSSSWHGMAKNVGNSLDIA